MKDPELQTHHTVQAHELADAVNAGLSKVYLAPGRYVPELTAPEGPSTAGGAQSMQHLRLVPRDAGFPTLVIGTANHVTGIAELRSFALVDSNYRMRFGQPVPLDGPQYTEFLVTARDLLEVAQLRVKVVDASSVDPSRTSTTRPPPAITSIAKSSSFYTFVGLVIGGLVLVAVLLVAISLSGN